MEKTPLYEIKYLYENEIKSLYVKDESKNISGSIKYRPAKNIIEKAYQDGLIDETTKICEVTSGNMGIAMAYVLKNYKNEFIVCMPSFVSKERIDILKSLNTKLILTPSFEKAFLISSELEKEGVFLTKQFENMNNATAYYDLCKEVEEAIKDIKGVVLGVGTGGTINGIGTYFKNKYKTKVIAVEPLQTLILSTGISHGSHKIEGLSDGLVPKLYPQAIVDEIISIDDNDAICMARKIKDETGIGVGISSGANILGAILSKIDKVFTVIPDDDSKYLSTDLTNLNIKSDLVEKIKFLEIKKVKN